MGLSYATEWFNAWYGGEHADRSLVVVRIHRRLCAAVLGACCSAMSSSRRRSGSPRVRRNIVAVFVIAVLINIGMWLERILIIWNTLSHDYLPSMWRLFLPTVWDWITTFGSLGLFALMFLVFVRLVPVVSMHEVRKLVDEEGVMTACAARRICRFAALGRGGAARAAARTTGWSTRSRRFRSKACTSSSTIAPAAFGSPCSSAASRMAARRLTASNIISAVINYPYNSGGRPLDAWPAFMLVPFATGILVAAIAGFAAFLIETGLPRLHHPLFAVEGFERASQDRFVLALEPPDGTTQRRRRHRLLPRRRRHGDPRGRAEES